MWAKAPGGNSRYGHDRPTGNHRPGPSQIAASEPLGSDRHILETKGLEGYTTNAIARRAGASIGSLYQYFPRKDAITRALIAQQSQALLSELEDIATSTKGRAALEQIIAVAVGHQLRRPALARLLDLEEQRLPLAPDMQQVGVRVIDVIRRCLIDSPLEQLVSDPFALPDLVAIIKGMVNSGGFRGERDGPALQKRVRRAVFGYLQL